MSIDDKHEEPETGHFVTLVRVFVLSAVALSTGGAVPALILRSRRLGAGASLVAAYGLFVFWIGRRGRRGESVITAAASVSYGLLVVIVALSVLTPFAHSSLTVIAIIAVGFGLPYLEGPRLKHLLGASFVAIAIIQINGNRAPSPAFIGLPQWVTWTTDRSATAIAFCLLFALIWHFNKRLNASMREEKASHALAIQAEARSSFLAEASVLLAESLDYKETLARIGRLAVPQLADWTTITIVDEDGKLRRLVAVHKDPDKAPLMECYLTRFPPEELPTGAYAPLIEGHDLILVPQVPDALLARVAQSPQHLDTLRALGLRSYMLLPLLAHGRLLGVMAFVRSSDEHPYTKVDLALAQDLVGRAALAVENARLYQAEQTAKLGAEAAVGVRDSFLSIAGHELRSPVSALELQIELLTRMAQRGDGSERLSAQLAKAAAAVGRLERLIGELLDVSRITTGHLSLEPERTDLAEVVRDVADELAESARRAGSVIRLEATGATFGVWDRLRLSQVTSNLLDNAIKYGRGQPIDVRLESDGESATMTVTDHGIGISAEDQARIFQRFERAVSEKHYGGLGLGLWIVRQIVEASGGTIAVRSTLGGGASFTVKLPCRPGSEAHAVH